MLVRYVNVISRVITSFVTMKKSVQLLLRSVASYRKLIPTYLWQSFSNLKNYCTSA